MHDCFAFSVHTVVNALRMNWLQQHFELSRGGGAHNVRPMEGLRGFAVFLVFLVHYTTFIDPWIAKLSPTHALARALHTIGNTGVDLFFVLSGYLIYGMLISRAQPLRRFLTRRVERIYPAFLAVFLIYIALSFIFPAHSKIPHDHFDAILYLIENFLLLPGVFPIEPMITVAWSLSYEMFYYFAIPLVIIFFGLSRRSVTWRVLFFSAIAIVTATYCAIFGGLVRLLMFVSGILLYETIKKGNFRAPNSAVALVALVVGLLCMLLPVSGALGGVLKMSILFASFFALCFSCFHYPNAWLGKAFSWTPVRWLGNMSYSYYLVHGLTLQASFLILGVLFPPIEQGFLFFLVLLPLMFALTLCPSALLFLVVERPLSLAPSQSRKSSSGLTDGAAEGTVGTDAGFPSNKADALSEMHKDGSPPLRKGTEL
jgi:exopolysaccharide production protein ExoZ